MDEERRVSSEEMDEKRQMQTAYHYLCHLEEARLWLSSCIEEDLPCATDLEESLRNGVYLARLANFFSPHGVPLKKIYDIEQVVYSERGLCFRHTDNINHWLNAMRAVGLPQYFFPDAFDLYEKKNLPKVIYCLHALSLYLFKLGKAPKMDDLLGKLEFAQKDIEKVRRTLQSNADVQMPAFSQIGGLLAQETSADASAVIAVNTAIDKNEVDLLLETLGAPTAALHGVRQENAARYQEVLARAKRLKAENQTNRSKEPSYVPDVYDRLLSHAEIQGYILETNVNTLLELIDAALENEDEKRLPELILHPDLALRDVVAENVEAYFQVLRKIRSEAELNGTPFTLLRSDLQVAVQLANEKVSEETQLESAVDVINACLDGDCPNDTLDALRDPLAGLPPLYPLAAQLYHNQLAFIRKEMAHNLTQEELMGGIAILNAVSEINFALRASSTFNLVEALNNPRAHIADVRHELRNEYARALSTALATKSHSVGFLTHTEVQEVVNNINGEVDKKKRHDLAVRLINEAISPDSSEANVVKALLNPSAMLHHVSRDHGLLYLNLLSLKAEAAEGNPLTADEIRAAVDTANQVAVEASNMCISLATVNVSICKSNVDDLQRGLEGLKLFDVVPGGIPHYLKRLRTLYIQKRISEDPIEWFSYPVRPNLFYNLNVIQFRSEWSLTARADCDSFLLLDEIGTIIDNVNSQIDDLLALDRIEPVLTRFQARAKGMLIRAAVQEQLSFYRSHVDSIIRIQAWYRGCRQRAAYHRMLYELDALLPFVVRLQSYVRGYIARKKLFQMVEHYKYNEPTVKAVQNCYRRARALRDYTSLIHMTPSLPVVQKFLHMLAVTEQDLSEELRLQQLEETVVSTIRRNQALEREVEQMDLKIGLLVRNCLSLEEVTNSSRRHAKREALRFSREDWLGCGNGGLTALSRQSHNRLVAYQHLFYQLQVEPRYLARLIFAVPLSISNKFIESVIYSLYNYGLTPREECLLLRLFSAALQEEVSSKISRPADMITGHPMAITMVVGFYRTKGGRGELEELLGPLVRSVMNDPNLSIDLRPDDIYKVWVNHLESSMGRPCGMSYDVTPEEALQHLEVCRRLDVSVRQLDKKARQFVAAITRGKDKIPYGIRYVAKVLKQALEERFPETTSSEILKVVGHMLYYRYLNPGIVAPDTFGVVEFDPQVPFSVTLRRNLGTIANLLQFAATATPFGKKFPYLARLTALAKSFQEPFQRFFLEACMVPEPEEEFGIDTYSEVTQLTPPTTTLTVQELRDTHQLLVEYEDVVAPDKSDILHEILKDVGPVPTIQELVGPGCDIMEAKTEICLSLTSKFCEVSGGEVVEQEADRVFVETKQMMVELFHFFPKPTTVRDMLHGQHDDDVRRRFAEAQESKVLWHGASTASLAKKRNESFDAFRRAALRNLQVLEARGLVSADDDYQEMLNAIARDILQKRNHRIGRESEMESLNRTRAKLEAKTHYYEEKLDYYQRYIQACLSNLAAGGGKRRRQSLEGPRVVSRPAGDELPPVLPSKTVYKCSATRLQEKGILLEVTGTTQAQLKTVSFEIVPREQPGLFTIRGKLKGFNADEVTIDIQDLLQKQYEGVAVMNLFGKATININLLLFLLNKKFYGK
ncbi:ras GTPase-activating-like protein IQGAP1 [Ornithodoros turicata]|uniref:ras GTPase-activating-like protein IQGAP1 n=1 Tax=Ornithodoros turicata TaxID=34597 RepID=UPI00313987D4